MNPIMLVTADKELVRVVQSALRDTEARVTLECSTPAAAIDGMSKYPVAMVILDLFLPNSSGLEVLKVLKRINENCLFLMLSRMRTRTMIERAFRFGAQDVLLYPVAKDILRDTVLHRLKSQPMLETEDSARKK